MTERYDAAFIREMIRVVGSMRETYQRLACRREYRTRLHLALFVLLQNGASEVCWCAPIRVEAR